MNKQNIERTGKTAARKRLFSSLLLSLGLGAFSVRADVTGPLFSETQARQGEAVYTKYCASCHGENLADGLFGKPLIGPAFKSNWAGKSVAALLDYVEREMPQGMPGALSRRQYLQVLAYMFERDAIKAGDRPLPEDSQQLALMLIPGAAGRNTFDMPPPPTVPANPLDRITAVTDAMLIDPPDGDWLSWRRTYDAQGFSPLRQIHAGNVEQLQLAWTWGLGPGENQSTPLVHDGVMFLQGNDTRVLAFNAASGELLWTHQSKIKPGAFTSRIIKRAMVIYRNRLIATMEKSRLVSLNVKTGALIWERELVNDGQRGGVVGGPLLAEGMVLIGLTDSPHKKTGGSSIVGLDAHSGEEVWRLRTVAQPGELGGDSWNGIAAQDRSGAGIWLAGSYDPKLKLAYFGTGNTYDTALIHDPVGSANNAALYTDSTLAIVPRTGELAWHFQHLPNDQWNYDWAFDRTLIQAEFGGRKEKVVMAQGKLGIIDAVRATDGAYMASIDPGIQNVVGSIDPRTGAKRINAGVTPGSGKPVLACPSMGGGRLWMPSSYHAQKKIIYMGMLESCQALLPLEPGEMSSLLTVGVRSEIRPRPDSDGLYGRLQAIDVETGKTAWTARQRAPFSSGVLATAGDLVFIGSANRDFSAYDANSGKALWRTRLTDIPNATPISYRVNGEQYIAITAGGSGNGNVSFWMELTPEIKNPDRGSPALWVFKLPAKPKKR